MAKMAPGRLVIRRPKGYVPPKNRPSFRRALKDARRELEQLFVERERLEQQIVHARQTVIALGRLCGEDDQTEFFKDLPRHTRGLTDAIRMVLMGATKPMGATDIRKALESVGYDPGSSPNVHRSIHTILRRLWDGNEVRQIAHRIKGSKPNTPGRFDDGPAFWWAERKNPEGWTSYPDKELKRIWKNLGKSDEARNRERMLEVEALRSSD